MDIHNKSDYSDRTPFQDRVNVNLFFSGAQRRKLLDEVKRALDKGAAVVTITGEEGVGKTMICRMVEKELPAETFSVYLPTPLESFDDVIRVLALEVGTDNADKPVSSKVLVDEIASELEIRERRLVVVFDQSERMYLATIERIRKMLDRVNDGNVLLQIVFAGRSSLLENLKQLAICNFKDVEERHFSLHPLGLSETYAYLNHCAQQRSSSRSKNVFTPEAAKKIYSMAQGNLRMTNMLAAKSLEAANTDTSFMVLLDNVVDDTRESVKKGRKRSVVSWPETSWRRWAYGGAGLTLLLAVFFFVFNDDDGQKEDGSGNTVVSAESVENSSLPTENSEELPAPERVELQTTEGAAAINEPVAADIAMPETVAGSKQKDEGAQGTASGDDEVENATDEGKKVSATTDSGPSMEKETPRPATVKNDDVVAGRGNTLEPEKEDPVIVGSPEEKVAQEVAESSTAATDVVKEPADGSERLERPTLTAGTESADAGEEQQLVATEDPAAKLQQAGEVQKDQPTEIALSPPKEQPKESQDKIQEGPDETPIQEEDYGEPVVFVGMKKRLPPQQADEGSTKKIVKIAPVKVKNQIAATSDGEEAAAPLNDGTVDELFKSSLARGQLWLQSQNKGSHTVQLMALTAEQAEDNLKNRFRQQEYRRIADRLYIVKGNSSTVYVYYGEYEDLDTARQARNSLPVFLRKDNPYAVSVEEAIAKAVTEL
ncbi:MAG TPA: AAA family ATPase [Desulfopila sp.]|nr:AAA family ATPase [Desulfopila sp.]